jgi:cytochrome c556
MNQLACVVGLLAACSGQPAARRQEQPQPPQQQQPSRSHEEYRRSSELNRIMKNEVNKPFSKLTFFVFHSDGDFDFSEIAKTTAEFRAGIADARNVPDLPVDSDEGREVFTTFLESLDRDASKLSDAVAKHDGGGMQAMLGKLSRTCNNCHHFFRLDIEDSPEK